MSQIKYLDLTGLETYHNRLRSGVLKFTDTENRSVTYKPGDTLDLSKGVYYATTSKTATRVSNSLTVETLDGSIEWNGSDKATIDLSTNWVIIKGDADNSAVLKGEYQGYSNKAISQVSTSIGAATTAGLKGWYYSKITFGNNPVITLSDKQPIVLAGNLSIGGWSSGTPNIKAGDKVSIVNNAKYDYCGEVKSVSGNTITLKSALPFESLDAGLIYANNPDDWSIYLPDNESAGIIDFGGGALAEGVNTKATNIGAHAEGIQTHAYGQYSHTEGFKTRAGYASHAEGRETTASGSRSHSEGDSTVASGDMSHAEGNSTKAIGKYSHAEGYSSSTEANASHAEGYSTTASGDSSHAEGWKSTAKGKRSHAEGSETYAGGHYSHTEGLGTKTTNEAEHASGKYNKSVTGTTLFSVGNGTSDADRKNAFEITSDGNVYIGGMDEDNKVATLQDVPIVDTILDKNSNNPIANSAVANAISGGVHFRGVYDRLPDELTDVVNEEGEEIDIETKQVGRWFNEEIEVIFYEGDIIIVSPDHNDGEYNGEYIPQEPTKEYILTYSNGAYDEWHWVELGDVTPAQEMIDASTLLVKGTGSGSVIVKDRGCIANGQYSTVFGRNGRAYGNYSYVEGRGQGDPSSISKDEAVNTWDDAESDGVNRLHLGVGDYVHVEGLNNIAIGNYSHVEGQRNKAGGHGSHAEGWKTQAIGVRSHAEGQSTVANGSESHAGGVGSVSTGARSFVHGNYVNTTKDDEVAFGKYNKSTSDSTLFSVGNGISDDNRKNAFEITEDAGYIHDEKIASISQKNYGYEYKFICAYFGIDAGAHYDKVEAVFNGELIFETDYWDFALEKVPLMGFDVTSYKISDGYEDNSELEIGQTIYIALDKNWKDNICGVTHMYMQPYDNAEQYSGSEYSTVIREYKENPYQGGVSTSMLKLGNVEIKSSDQQLVLNIGSISGRKQGGSEDSEAHYVKAIYTGEDVLYKNWIDENNETLNEPIIDSSKGKAMKFEIFESENNNWDENPFIIGEYLYVKINSWTSENYTTDFNTDLYWENHDDIGYITNISNYVIYKSNEQIDGSGIYIDSNISINDIPVATINDIQTFNHIKEYDDKVNIDIPVYSTKFFENGISLVNKYAQKSLVTQLSNTISKLQNTINDLVRRIEVLEGYHNVVNDSDGTCADVDGTCADASGPCADGENSCGDNYGTCADYEGVCADNEGSCGDNYGSCGDGSGTCADNYGLCGDNMGVCSDDNGTCEVVDDNEGSCVDNYGSCGDNFGSCADDSGACGDGDGICADNYGSCGEDGDGLCGDGNGLCSVE